MFDDREICGTCIYHQYDKQDEDWCCDNQNSDRYTDWTEYTDTCGEWDGRE